MRYWLGIIVFLLFVNSGQAATLFSITSGDWSTNGTWSLSSGGGSCTCTPSNGDSVVIQNTHTITLSGDMNTAISGVTVQNGGTLDGENNKVEGITGTLRVESGGVVEDIEEMKDIDTAIINEGRMSVTGEIKWKNGSNPREMFNNSGYFTAEKVNDGQEYYPSPVGTDNPFYTFENSDSLIVDKLQIDGYFTNTATGVVIAITGDAEVHIDGIICNYNIVQTTELKIHGGRTECSGDYIIDIVNFDTNDKQISSDQKGTMAEGNYCTSAGEEPELQGKGDNSAAKVDEHGIIDTASTSICSQTLPVELVGFEAETFGDEVVLHWSTASEFNNSHFEILYSENGRDFEAMGGLAGMGTTNTTSHYTFKHRPVHGGVVYYQLKQVDYDGTAVFSKVISVALGPSTMTMEVQNHPVTNNELHLEYGKGYKDTEVCLYDNHGGLVETAWLPAQSHHVIMDLDSVRPGVYILSLHDGKRIKILKL